MSSFKIPLALLSTLALTLPLACGTNSDEQQSAEGTRTYDSYEPARDSITIPAGTELVASLDQAISTDANKSGDAFRATVSVPLMVDGRTVLNSGSSVRGVLREVRESGDAVGRAHMTLAFETLVSSTGTSHDISARPLTLQAATEDATVIVKGEALGLDPDDAKGEKDDKADNADNDGIDIPFMGDDTNDGSVLVFATHGEDVRLESGQRVVVHFTGPMRVMVLSRN